MIKNFPTSKFKLIYADPPWKYDNERTGGSMKSGASQKYGVMTFEEINALPVPSISDANSVLFMWIPVPLMVECLPVMNAWGFKYKTALFWHKMRYGTGFWFRGCVEICLLGVKGNVKPIRDSAENLFETYDVEGWYESKSKIHSKKPEEVQLMLERISEKYGLNPKVELFARRERKSWTTWGDWL